MAKVMFYSQEETQQKLGLSATQIQDLCSQGKLRALRDQSQTVYKADQVDAIAASMSGVKKGDSVIGLEDDFSPTVAGAALGQVTAGDSRAGSKTGTSVFGDSNIAVDPNAQTAVTQSQQGPIDHLAAGSGLIGIQIEQEQAGHGLEGITPPPPLEDEQGLGAGGQEYAQVPAIGEEQGMVPAETRDPWAVVFGGLAAAGSVIALVGVYFLFAGIAGVCPDAAKTIMQSGPMYFALGVVVLAAGLGVGFLMKTMGGKARA